MYQPVVYERAPSYNSETVNEVYNECESTIIYHLEQLNQKTSVLGKRIQRDLIDFTIRRAQGYSRKVHYIEEGFEPKDCDREHVIPAKVLRDELIRGNLTIQNCFDSPICYLSKDKHKQLKKNGYASIVPDLDYFFKRYTNLFDISILDYQINLYTF
jgi:hypothetical protein